jgi:hypothetical protein
MVALHVGLEAVRPVRRAIERLPIDPADEAHALSIRLSLFLFRTKFADGVDDDILSYTIADLA